MNRYLLLSGLLAFCGLFYAFTTIPKLDEVTAPAPEGKNVQWMTWEEAITASQSAKAAGKTPKKIFVDIYTNWCGWCKKMDKETFEQPEIARYLNEHYYPVKFNAEQRETINFRGRPFKFIQQGSRGYHELAVALLNGKMSYPTVVFLDENIQIIQPISGYLKVDLFDMILHFFAGNYYKNTSWETFQEVYKKQKAMERAKKPASHVTTNTQ